MNNESLMIFSIGPVQSFIAAARKIEDLWSGSYLLSYLIETAMTSVLKEAEEQKIMAQMVYPARTLDELQDFTGNSHIEVASLPNRFVCLLGTDQEHTAQLASGAQKAVRERFIKFCKFAIHRAFRNIESLEKMEEMAVQQVDAILEIFWATEAIQGQGDYPKARQNLEKNLAAVKNRRQYSLNPQEGLVCSLCGQQQALLIDPVNAADTYAVMKQKLYKTWSRRSKKFLDQEDGGGRIQEGEYLCAICLAKRLCRDYFQQERDKNAFKKFDSTHEIANRDGYYAIIKMDGDDMGKRLSGKKGQGQAISIDINYHQDISNRLANYAMNTVPVIVEKQRGRLIYAGGDDVLAFVRMDNVLSLAKELRQAFSDKKDGLYEEATASMGLVVAHEKAPLQRVLNQVRHQEEQAKSYVRPVSGKEKDALSIAVITHRGEIREATIPWTIEGQQYVSDSEKCMVNRFSQMLELIRNDLSTTFMQHFAEAFIPLLGVGIKKGDKLSVIPDESENCELLELEMRRLLKRSLKENAKDIYISKQAHLMIEVHELMPSTLQFIHLLQIIRFFKRMEETAK